MIDLNPKNIANDIVNFGKETIKGGADLVGDLVKGGTQTAVDLGSKAGIIATQIPAFLDATVFQPKPFFPSIVDIVDFIPFNPAPGSSLGPEYQGLMDDLGGLNDQIAAKREELANASPEDRNTIALELQGLLQERLQLISTVSNLLKQENDAAMAVINNLRG